MSKCNDKFNSIFADKLYSFVKFKQGMGWSYSDASRALVCFDKYVIESKYTTPIITKELINSWIENYPNANQTTIRIRLIIIREFAKYCEHMGMESYCDFEIPKKSHAFKPYIFSVIEINEFFEVADQYPKKKSTYTHLVVPLFFRLLYYCGLRCAEAINLHIRDINIKNQTLYIEKSKYGKSRYVPMSEDVLKHIIEYINIVHNNSDTDALLFTNVHGDPLSEKCIYTKFRNILWKAGIMHGGRGNGPRMHDLRHSYAVHRLQQWIEDGVNTNSMLPYLSAYMGHENIYMTEEYLHLTYEQFSLITQKMEPFNSVIPKVGDYLG